MSSINGTSGDGALRIFRRESPVRVLGPHARAVVWVQGCAFGCTGCIVPESWDSSGGEQIAVDDLARWLVEQPNEIEGATLSGGEPMMQARALSSLIDRVREERDTGIVCYTGYTLEHLRERGTPDQRALLGRIDLLIDGVYRTDMHDDLLWRGSRNQRLLHLTSRYVAEVDRITRERGDRTAGIEVTMDVDGAIGFAGVPARPGFRDEFVRQMSARGIRLGIGAAAGQSKESMG